MDVKINNNGTLVDATIEMIDGVMVVSPNVEKYEPKDGDVITCTNSCCTYTLIVKRISTDLVFHYAVLIDNGMFRVNCSCDYSNPHPATKEEKQRLFDRLKEEGYEWKPATKELVKLKWKPELHRRYFAPWINMYGSVSFFRDILEWENDSIDKGLFEKGWVFKTDEECQEFCDKLNQAIEGVKP